MSEYFRSRRYSGDPGAEPDQGSKLWLIIYTDMISNLMIFFLMLYCLTWLGKTDSELAAASMKEAFAGEKGKIDEVLQKVAKGLDKDRSLEGRIKEEFTNVEVSERMITIVLPSPVLFDSGSAELKPMTRKSLKDIAEMVRALNNQIVVEGFTDDKPISSGKYASNWELSCARAFSVIRYFSEKEKIQPKRLSAMGYGEFRPKVPNNNEQNRAKNRRIEISIIKGI